MKILADVFNIS